jgi:hypothetical protein
MNRRVIIVSVAIFIVIVAGMFVFAYMKRNEAAPKMPSTENAQPQEEVKYASITRITAKHFFADGVHTLAGEVPMPTPCDLLQANARVEESSPEHVVVDFTVINNAEFCAQQETMQRFKVSANAGADATFSATLEGRPVELNLVPAAPGETPDDFELYQKG